MRFLLNYYDLPRFDFGAFDLKSELKEKDIDMKLLGYTIITFTSRKKVRLNLNLFFIKLLLLQLVLSIFLLSGCMTVPIQDRNFSEAGGFWEQDENTDPRFNHGSITGKEMIGILYASGSNTMMNGSRVEASSEISNNAFVSTGPQSGARIEFKSDNNACLISIQDFSTGNGYGDTSNCQHNIVTKHAGSETQNSIYHINVSYQKTEFTVLRGSAKLSLLSNVNQIITVNGGEEAIVTADAISGPHPVAPDEIERRIRWRGNYHFSRSKVDWTKVLIGVGTVGAAAAAAILLNKSGGSRPGGGRPGGGGTDSGIGSTNQSIDPGSNPTVIDTPNARRAVPVQLPAPTDIRRTEPRQLPVTTNPRSDRSKPRGGSRGGGRTDTGAASDQGSSSEPVELDPRYIPLRGVAPVPADPSPVK